MLMVSSKKRSEAQCLPYGALVAVACVAQSVRKIARLPFFTAGGSSAGGEGATSATAADRFAAREALGKNGRHLLCLTSLTTNPSHRYRVQLDSLDRGRRALCL